MKVSLNTIRQYIDFELPPVQELVERINRQLGGVEAIIDLGAKYKDAVIVKVLSVDKHGNADKLSVCVIDDGGVVKEVERDKEGHVQVVCGAPNVHGGMLAIWLPPASTVPASYGDEDPFVLSVRDIRGVTSNGMLAAADELAIGTDHEGIVEIDPDEWRPYDTEIKPGTNFAVAYGLNDTIIDIENKMFTHRPDLFGQLGVAREIAGIQQHMFTSPDWYLTAPAFEQANGLELAVTNDAADKVPRFMAVAIKDIQVKPSPLWLQCALVAMGGKPINNIVDATNYIMLLTAQPTHAYDYDKLRGHKLGTRMARAGERLTLLNGKTYALNEADIVIVDGEGPVGLAGIMGGGNSEVSADTKNIVLEVANFDMYTVRKSSMRHGLFTDALTRFTKGQSPLQNDHVMYLLIRSIFDVAGGSQASGMADLVHFDDCIDTDLIHTADSQGVTSQFVNERLGLKLADDEIKTLLTNVEFTVEIDKSGLEIFTPFWRTDIIDPEDIIEEVGRLYGFDKLPRKLPSRSIRPAPQNPVFEMKRAVRQVLKDAGANEVLTYSFVHERTLRSTAQDITQAYQLGNALSPDLQYYRLSVLPSLLEHVHANIKAGYDNFALFELGKAHNKGELDSEGLPKEVNALGYVYAAGKPQQGAAYYHARRVLERLLDICGISSLRFEPLEGADLYGNRWLEQMAAPFEPQRSAVLRAVDDSLGGTNGLVWGVVGEYKTSVRRAFKLPDYSAGFELDPLMFQYASGREYAPLSRFPHITQDISLKLPAGTAYSEFFTLADATLDTLRTSELRLSLVPLDIYEPEESGSKTITLRLTAVHYARTLTDADAAQCLNAIEAAGQSLGGVRS